MSDEWDKTIDEALAEVDAMTPERRTLYLARAGISPLDMEASLQRCMAKIEALEAARAVPGVDLLTGEDSEKRGGRP